MVVVSRAEAGIKGCVGYTRRAWHGFCGVVGEVWSERGDLC